MGTQLTSATAFPNYISRYELQAIIGRGGVGTVYKAYDPQLDRLVAIKAISIADPSLRARFRQEARIAGQLNHPHIVTVYDVGEMEDLAYIVMELIEGQTLADLLPSRLAWFDAVKLLLPVCGALDYAHGQGIIHRDVKPPNILLSADGRVKLTDFGIARLEAALGLTKPGAVLGTPPYMAPEQRDGEPVDRRADIFAVGVILFELITGQHPFIDRERTRGWGLLMQPTASNFTLLEGLTPLPVQAVIRQAMADDRAARFTTAAEMLQALMASLGEVPDQATDIPIVATAAVPPLPIEVSGEVTLSSAERDLLAEAFSGHDRIYIEGELSDPAEDARLLVALPIRSGRSLARVIARLASPEMLSREWKAYQEFVAGILPLVTAHIQGAPLLAPDRKLALLRYTFAADVGEHQAENLAIYYRSHTGADVVNLLEQNIFRAVAPNWWLNREADSFLLRREYDHLLPVHLVVEQTHQGEDAPLVLKAGTAKAQDVRYLEPGQAVQLQGFRVSAIRRSQGVMILRPTLSSGSDSQPLRIQLSGLSSDELRYRPGDLVPNFAGAVVATRHHLLSNNAQAAFPSADLAGPNLTRGGVQFPNPLLEYEHLLDQRISGMISIIHGGLRLESILTEPESGLAWLINFAETRQGHNLYDFLQLETQIVIRFLSPLVAETGSGLENDIISMGRVLHSTRPPSRAPHLILQKPYDVLRAIRRRAGESMLDPFRWDEYYKGLVMLLLGALSSASENPIAERLALTWAAVACEQMGQPLRAPVLETEPAWSRLRIGYLWLALGLVSVAMVLAILVRVILPTRTQATPSPVGAALTSATLLPSSTFTLTSPPAQIASRMPGSTVVAGTLVGALNIYSGPGKDYPIVGTAGDGTIVQITGRNLSGDWLQIADPAVPGGYGWVEAQFVTLEIAGTPVLLIAKASPPPTVTPTPTATPIPPPTATPLATPVSTSTPVLTATSPPPSPTSIGTPTVVAGLPREAVYDTPGYRALAPQLASPPLSAAFSPFGYEIAVTEGIKLYTVSRDASYGHIWMEEDETIRPIGGAVWSPDGRYIAFMADRKQNCGPCRVVGLVRLSDGWLHYLVAPTGRTTDLPRWTQDGRLLVTVHAGDPASGTPYIYDTSGQGQVASGSYVLSSSHEGQRWFPWQPGRTWETGIGSPTSYYSD